MHDKISAEEQALLDKFLADNQLWLGPDPEIMRNHSLSARSQAEDEILKKGLDTHQVHHVRGLINAALSEAFTMCNQMGAAPGAKWGDLVTGIYTAQGDLAMIAPHGIIAFAACCFYPIRFINKYWTKDPTVGVRDGDGFIHNDARYGGIHNTDQSMMMPLYYKGELVCWLSATIHEGENGACEPGGMPAAAESKYDEGIKMSPFKVVENFQLKRDLVTFLQNSVRDPKLQLEDMKVKLHAVMRLRERIIAILDQFGRDALLGTLRLHLEDTEAEMRRRIREMPDGTTRVLQFMDSSLRENCLQKISLAITVKGDRLIMDFRGTAPQFMNRSVNTNIASFKAALCTGLLQNIWPDLPHTMAVLSPIEIITDRNSIIDAEGEMPQAMSLMPLFKGCVVWTIPMNKLNYSVPHRYSAIIASQYDQAATFIYGGVTQHGDVTGNFCGDINGNGQGARSHADGEHSVSPVFGFMCDSGEHEINEEDTPIIRLGAQRLAKDRIGWGKYRGGMGYEQIATARGSSMWGFMTGCEGSKFPSAQGLFGGYSCPSYQLMKIKGINIFQELKQNPKLVEVFDILKLMNERPIPGARYSSHDMGMTFEVCNEGEIYMICQGSGGGYGDVLERDPQLVMKDLAEDLMSHENARDIYKVVYDERTLVVDEEATRKLRDDYRKQRLQRGKPFDQFCKEWVAPEPPAHLPYFGSWENPREIYATTMGQRVKMPADQLQGAFMLNPKDLRLLELEGEVEQLKSQLADCQQKRRAAMTDYGQLFRLDGKVALVTGGARGIGAAVAEALAQAGAAVLVSDILEGPGRETVARIRKAGGKAEFQLHDVTDEAQWVAAVAAATRQLGGLDILVNNAGIETAALLTQCTVEDFRRLMDVNVTGVFLGLKHAVSVMGRGASIINLSSVAGLIGTTGHIAYHASKGAVRLMTKAAAIECAQLGTGIRVNSVHPAIVQTDMGTHFIQHFVDLKLAPDYATAEAAFKAAHPLGRFGEPADVASAVIYLASDAASWVTGIELVLDGGYTAA